MPEKPPKDPSKLAEWKADLKRRKHEEYVRNKPKYIERALTYYEQNTEKVKAQVSARYWADPEEGRRKSRDRARENADANNERSKKWRDGADPERRLRMRLYQRAWEYQLRYGEKCTYRELQFVIDRDKKKNGSVRCHHCGVVLDLYAASGFTFDHLEEDKMKGPSPASHIVISCHACNFSRKNGHTRATRTPHDVKHAEEETRYRNKLDPLERHVRNFIRRVKKVYGVAIPRAVIDSVIESNSKRLGSPTCQYCREAIDLQAPNGFHFEHATPIWQHGEIASKKNIVLACVPCSVQKSAWERKWKNGHKALAAPSLTLEEAKARRDLIPKYTGEPLTKKQREELQKDRLAETQHRSYIKRRKEKRKDV